jgi:hypothetical protein
MNPPAVLHQTDLFRPHNDPDDHWDLACVYALALQGRFRLTGVLIDYPCNDKCAPDVLSVSQLNDMTGLSVPVVTGSATSFAARAVPVGRDVGGAGFVLEQLRGAPDGLVINIVGSCRDIAIALQQAPELFREKCRGIYLNAGMGARDAAVLPDNEYNVTLDPLSYAAIFQAPCPVYWMPCFEDDTWAWNKPYRAREYATYYRFRQGDILPSLSPSLHRYFAFMLARSEHSNWFREISADHHQSLMEEQNEATRQMWCTAGFFHAAGLGISKSGEIKPIHELGEASVFRFVPANITCDASGLTKWNPDSNATRQFIFHVADPENYCAAMIAAMRTLLMAIP